MHNVGWGCAETLPKVVIKKETFTANHGSFPQDFHKEFSEHEVFRGAQFGHMNYFVKTQL